MTTRVSVSVQRDYLEKIRQTRPILAVIELIWNCLDADANRVEVRFEFDRNQFGLEELRAIVVSDDGHGMRFDEAEAFFGKLGGSWKALGRKSRGSRRALHGKAGKGRFRAFGLGFNVEWKTVALNAGRAEECIIAGSAADLSSFVVEGPMVAKDNSTGTEVRISDIRQKLPSLTSSSSVATVTEHLAMYLDQYAGVTVVYNGERIDPASYQAAKETLPLNTITVKTPEGVDVVDADLTLIEWKDLVKSSSKRRLLLCNSEGMPLHEVPLGSVPPRAAPVTAYVSSTFFDRLAEAGLEVFDEFTGPLVEAARRATFKWVEQRFVQRDDELLEQWKREKVYPYKQQPVSAVEAVSRELFDWYAKSVATAIPELSQDGHHRTKTLIFQLLRNTIEEDPDQLLGLMEQVLDLPREKKEKLVDLLRRTTLSSIIETASTVTKRLTFLETVQTLLHEKPSKELLRERDQLHLLLAKESWVFGDEFSLIGSETGLTEVLRRHRLALGQDAVIDEPVRADGDSARVDLLFSGALMGRYSVPHRLIVELKRPSQVINEDICEQVRKYARAIRTDERFDDSRSLWTFWVIGNQLNDGALEMTREENRPEGLLAHLGRTSIWVKTWAEVISEARLRYKFLQERLEFVSGRDDVVSYLKSIDASLYPSYLTSTGDGEPKRKKSTRRKRVPTDGVQSA